MAAHLREEAVTRYVLVGGHRHGEVIDTDEDPSQAGLCVTYYDAEGSPGVDTYSPMIVTMYEQRVDGAVTRKWIVLCARGGDVDGRIARLLLEEIPAQVHIRSSVFESGTPATTGEPPSA
jgi:hypothetical protein